MGLILREIYAVVPRRYLDKYWHMAWDCVLVSATRGQDGLELFKVVEVNGYKVYPTRWLGRAGERAPELPGVAYLTEGQGDFTGKTVLYQQNW